MGIFAKRAERLGTENAFKVGPYIREVEEAGHRVIKCNLGEPDFPLPQHIRQEVQRQLELDNTHYCDPQGILPLREAIARDMGQRRGLPITADRVVVFPGAKPAIAFSLQTYCDPGDEVIYPSPGFPIYESMTEYLGARPVPLHLEESRGFAFAGEDLAPLISERTRLIILNFPSNPTGGVASREQLASIAEVIRRRAPAAARIYSDEVYEEILFDGSRHFSIASLPGMAERTVIVGGASKSYSWTGGRLGWAVLPSTEETAHFKTLNINYFSCVPPFNQMGAKVAIESPESRVEIGRMVAAFQERRDLVVRELNAIPGVTCQNPKGAFYVFPNIGGALARLGAIDFYESLPAEQQATTSPATIFRMFLLFRHHVAAMDRRSFGVIGSAGRHFLRVSIATGLDDLREGMQRLARATADRAGFAEFVATEKRLS